MYKCHPALALFPLMDSEELDALVSDIKEHGLAEPIVLHEEMVLDGRGRLTACALADAPAVFVQWEPKDLTAAEYVVSTHIHRCQHLSTSLRAVLGLDLLPYLEGENEMTNAEVAALVGVGSTTILTLKRIQGRDETGAVLAEVRAGLLNVRQAQRKVGLATNDRYSGILDNGKRSTDGKVVPVSYGRGDKFDQATLPLIRYLKAWESRGFVFDHVPPKEARRRLEVIKQLLVALGEVHADLETRQETARLRL
jgi:ParB-like nuclease domain